MKKIINYNGGFKIDMDINEQYKITNTTFEELKRNNQIISVHGVSMKENYEATISFMKDLIMSSNIIDNDEKSYWKDLLSVMTEEQLRKLINIIVLDKKEEIKELNLELMQNYGNNENI